MQKTPVSMDRKTYIGWILLLIGTVVVGYAAYAEWRGLSKLNLLRYDYGFFYCAFHIVLNHKASAQLYDISAQKHFFAHWHFPILPYNQYVYPPQFALLWSWLGNFSFPISAGIWMGLSAVLYGLGVYWIAKLLWPRLSAVRVWAILLCAAFLTPVQIDLGAGNVNSLLFAAFSLTFYLLYARKKAWLAGIPLGLAIIFKVTPLAVLVYLLLRRQWKAALSTAFTTIVCTGLTVLWLGAAPLQMYVREFLTFGKTSMKNGPAPYNQSLIGILGMFTKHHVINAAPKLQTECFLLLGGIAGLTILYIILRTRSNWRIDISLACLAPLLFSPLVEEMHMMFALPALLVLIRRVEEEYAYRWASRSKAYVPLTIVTVVSFVLMSLPVTFILNLLVNHWPQLYWIQIQMFVVLILLFSASIWQAIRLDRMDSIFGSKVVTLYTRGRALPAREEVSGRD